MSLLSGILNPSLLSMGNNSTGEGVADKGKNLNDIIDKSEEALLKSHADKGDSNWKI